MRVLHYVKFRDDRNQKDLNDQCTRLLRSLTERVDRFLISNKGKKRDFCLASFSLEKLDPSCAQRSSLQVSS